MKTEDFKLGELLANEQLGEITFNLDVHGRHITDQLPVVDVYKRQAGVFFLEFGATACAGLTGIVFSSLGSTIGLSLIHI